MVVLVCEQFVRNKNIVPLSDIYRELGERNSNSGSICRQLEKGGTARGKMGDASQRTTESPRAKRGAFLPLEGATDEALDSLLVALDETKKVKKVTRGRRIKASRDLLKWKNLTDPNAIPSSSGQSVTVAATCISQGRAKDSDSRYSLSLECGTDGEVRTLRCTCPYAQKSDEGFCKHTIALIM